MVEIGQERWSDRKLAESDRKSLGYSEEADDLSRVADVANSFCLTYSPSAMAEDKTEKYCKSLVPEKSVKDTIRAPKSFQIVFIVNFLSGKSFRLFFKFDFPFFIYLFLSNGSVVLLQHDSE